MRPHCLTLLLLLLCGPIVATNELAAASRCHVFIDYQFIWTLELVQTPYGSYTPILNIVTFKEGQWDLRPNQIHLISAQGEEAEIKQFSIDTGVPGEPYIVQYLKVQGGSFIGMDLIGDFEGIEELDQASIELGNSLFYLESMDCMEYEGVVHRVNQINFESPDIRQDYDVLKVELRGRREARRVFY